MIYPSSSKVKSSSIFKIRLERVNLVAIIGLR
nr:MAG TPA: hypothetical protein [Caudoviricetes sp.]